MSQEPKRYKDGLPVNDLQSDAVKGYQTQKNHWEIVNEGVPIGANLDAKGIWDSACRYFLWCDLNPIYKPELMRSGKKVGAIFNVPVHRPYTITGLCLHLGITKEYLYNVAKSSEQNDFYFVANKILEIIYTQKLEGAMTGIYNAFVTTKEIGLNDLKGPDRGAPIINISVDGDAPKLLTDEQDIDISKLDKPESTNEQIPNEQKSN